ncbi:MAG: hypothetical protein ACRD1V_17875 [Vicinamibacterales bacterium]
MANASTVLAGLIGVGGFALIAIGGFVYVISLPWLLFSGARSLRRQATQLERIADAIEHANRGGRDEVRELELARRRQA